MYNLASIGNAEILNCDKVAFLSSRRVPPAAVMASYDWASRMCAEGTCVIGGFQSPLERDVLKILLKEGTQPIVLVLARKMWCMVPTEYRAALGAGRLLVISPVSQAVNRVSAETALVRNRFVLANCSRTPIAITLIARNCGSECLRPLTQSSQSAQSGTKALCSFADFALYASAPAGKSRVPASSTATSATISPARRNSRSSRTCARCSIRRCSSSRSRRTRRTTGSTSATASRQVRRRISP